MFSIDIFCSGRYLLVWDWKTIYFIVELAERLLPTPENLGSNPVKGNLNLLPIAVGVQERLILKGDDNSGVLDKQI